VLIGAVVVYAALFLRPLFGPANLGTIGLQVAVLGLVSLGQMLVLLVRGLDLSVGAVMALGAVLVVDTQAGRPLAVSVLLAVGLALLIGAANGWLIVKRHVPPFVATLGMLIFVEGIRLAYTRGQASGAVPDVLRSLAVDGLGPIRWAVLIWIVVSILLYVVLAHTAFGRATYATGSNPAAARLARVPVDRVVVVMFIGSSLLALLTGVVLSGYIGYVDQHLGAGYNLNSITAAVIGGTSFSGGRGGVVGTAAGVLLVTLLINVVVVAGLPVEMQYVVEGVVLIAAVALQGLRLQLSSG
jgi:ribose/xylose/arabinose/galactoside ABC-type transport system permease subunit